MRLILASSSPRRRLLLQKLGLDFAVMKPQIDESRRPGESLTTCAERLSRQKAAAVAVRLGDEAAVVIAADTMVALDDEWLGKPRDADEARRMLKKLRGRRHQVYTAFTLHQTGQPPRIITTGVCTHVFMRGYADAEIEAYIASGDPFDKAGAYAIQNRSFRPVDRIEGSYANVVGLPLDELGTALDELGVAGLARKA